MSINYKKIIKNQRTRLLILNLLSFVPDKQMLKIQYFLKTGRRLNLENPMRYTEKIQWYKLYYRDPVMATCVDKADVREFVESRGLKHILNKCYGIYDSPKEIPYEVLPNSFVLKDTLGGGGNSVVLVRDKNNLDTAELNVRLKKWVNISIKKDAGREWVYEKKKHRIIVEKLLDCENGDLPDYKFFCFNGEPKFLYFMRNYRSDHSQGELAFFDMEFRLLEVYRTDFKPIKEQPEIPRNFEKMVEMARVLSKGFPHVRVDFYNIDGTIIFGEMTFFNARGYTFFSPDSFDFTLGECFELPHK